MVPSVMDGGLQGQMLACRSEDAGVLHSRRGSSTPGQLPPVAAPRLLLVLACRKPPQHGPAAAEPPSCHPCRNRCTHKRSRHDITAPTTAHSYTATPTKLSRAHVLLCRSLQRLFQKAAQSPQHPLTTIPGVTTQARLILVDCATLYRAHTLDPHQHQTPWHCHQRKASGCRPCHHLPCPAQSYPTQAQCS